jgi:hypothetical protein
MSSSNVSEPCEDGTSRLMQVVETKELKRYAQLTLTDLDNGEEEVYEREYAKADVQGANEVQKQGAAGTYQKRYLYMDALEINEDDASDGLNGSPEQNKTVEDAKKAAPVSKVKETQKAVPVQTAKEEPIKTGNTELNVTEARVLPEGPLTQDSKTEIGELILSKGKAPADVIGTICSALGIASPVDIIEADKERIIDYINKNL